MDAARLVASLNFSELQELKKACEARIEFLAEHCRITIVKAPTKTNFELYLEAINTMTHITGMDMGEVRKLVDAVGAGIRRTIIISSEGNPLVRLANVGVDVELG
jgi:hypothetical protein